MKVYDVFVRYNDGNKEIAEEMYTSTKEPSVQHNILCIYRETEVFYIPFAKIYSFTITERDIT